MGTLPFALGPSEALVGCAAVAVGAAVQGSVGFGLAILAAPMLVLLEPRLVPGPMLACGFVLTLLIVYRERRTIDLGGLRWAVAGRLVGTTGAAAFLSSMPRDALSIVFGALVLVAVILSASGGRLRPSPASLLFAGTLSGFMGTITSIGGPPMALIYQDERGPRMRGTLSGFFLVGTAVSVTTLCIIGRFGVAEMLATLMLLPGILLGFAISMRTARLLDRQGIRPLVLLLAGTAGCAVIVRTLF